jgi:hypothetical protein
MVRIARCLLPAVLMIGVASTACRGEEDNTARTQLADLQTSVASLQTIAARPTSTPVPPPPTATPVLAVVVRNTNAKDTECQGDQSQLIEWSYQGNTFSACFDPTGACARLARIGGGLPAECGGVFEP